MKGTEPALGISFRYLGKKVRIAAPALLRHRLGNRSGRGAKERVAAHLLGGLDHLLPGGGGVQFQGLVRIFCKDAPKLRCISIHVLAQRHLCHRCTPVQGRTLIGVAADHERDIVVLTRTKCRKWVHQLAVAVDDNTGERK